jgi:hypothetical protein
MLKSLILSILLSLPRTPGDATESDADRNARLDVLATAIDSASRSNPGLAGALIEQANSESHLDGAVAQCQCKAFECDPVRGRNGQITFLARGYFQPHKLSIWTDERFDSFCRPLDVSAMTFMSRSIAVRIDVTSDKTLACSFAHLKRSTVPCTAPWAVARASRARGFAARLRGGK